MGPETIEILRLTKFSSHVFQFDHVNLPPEIENESLLLNEYGSLMLGLVCQRAWSQVHFGLVFPYCLSRILSHEQTEKNRAQNLLRSLCRGILDLEEAAEKSHEKSPRRKLLRDVGTNNWVIVRELFVHGISVDWRPEDPELRAMAFSLAAGPTSTKYCLENVLSSVKDAGARVQKNTKHMGLFSKWMNAATSHHAPAGGVEQIQVERDDLLQVPFKQQSFRGKQTWEKGAVESFRKIFPSAEQILNEIRKAGYHANKLKKQHLLQLTFSMSTIVSLPMLEKLGQACVPWDLFDIFILQRYGIRQIGDIRQQISYQEIRKRKVNTR